jgi:hypothetical protein
LQEIVGFEASNSIFDSGGVTGVDFGFVANCQGDEGLGGQITQFVSDVVMARDHETTFLVPKSMLDAKFLTAFITM